MLDLTALWKNIAVQSLNIDHATRCYPKNTQKSAIHFDKNTVLSSFEFQEPPNVVFVKNKTTLEAVTIYDDLPELKLTSDEKAFCAMIMKKYKKQNPRFYDGLHMIISAVIYDDCSNTIYVEASKAPYSFILAFNHDKFPKDSALYQRTLFKTGVLAPLVTKDGMTMIAERVDGLYSVFSGFLEVANKHDPLNFSDDRNFVTETAIHEIKEEIAGIKGSDNLRFDYSKPNITCVVFRQTGSDPLGSIDFIAPSNADCHSRYLRHVFLNNLAPDAHEHTDAHLFIPLYSQTKEELLTQLVTGSVRLPGHAVYMSILLNLTQVENRDSCLLLPRDVAHL